MTKTSNDRYAQHIGELARRFRVHLNVQPGMSPAAAGAGYRIVICPQCDRPNVLRRSGTLRCGACKHPLGKHSAVQSIMIAPVVDAKTYAIALHELGHCLHPSGRITEVEASSTMKMTHRVETLRDMHMQLLEETSAWEWAEHYALEWTAPMQALKRHALSTYEQFARQLGINVRTV